MGSTGAIFWDAWRGRHGTALDDGWRRADFEAACADDEGVGPLAGKVEDFSFVQISDSHIGFNKGANPDVTGTLKKAIEQANWCRQG